METTISGLVMAVTKISPFFILFRSSLDFIILTIPEEIPGEAAKPSVKISPSKSISSNFSSDLSLRVVIGLVCSMKILSSSIENSMS